MCHILEYQIKIEVNSISCWLKYLWIIMIYTFIKMQRIFFKKFCGWGNYISLRKIRNGGVCENFLIKLATKSIFLDEWVGRLVDGCKSHFEDCLQQSKLEFKYAIV